MDGAQAASARGASGSAPRLCVTTTPRPTAALRGLRAEASCVETHAGTRENAAHLSPGFLAGLEALYGGTRRAAQELEGRVVELDGALFTAEMLAAARRPHGSGSPKGGSPWDRVVVAVDPSVTAGGDACGIVAAGRCGDRAVVLADRSARGLSPEGWARRALRTAEEFGARTIVAEVNQGGDLVRAVLAAAGSRVKLRAVRATRGKRVRAEPVAALYEQGRVTHAGTFGPLEEELMAMGGPDEAAESLDRADALVWAITDLLIDRVNAGAGPQARLLDWRPPPSGISGRAW
ncbi:MAG: DNA-packaging protein [Brevundimonas sp.]|nr:DNA-packaging protein [Brevundimonas sp.]